MSQAAIIIPHFNDCARLIRCLTALLPQLDDRFELVVVDNGSTQDLRPLRSQFPKLRIVTEPKQGAAEARNRGVAETSAPLLCFLDADCIPAQDWASAALAVGEAADLIGGRVALLDETPPPRTGAEAFETVFAFQNRHYVTSLGFSVTANLLTQRAVFEAVGPFVPGVSEDLDWCHRARDLGFGIVYEEALQVAHPTRPDWAALRKKWLRLTQESYELRPKTLAARLGWAGRALAMPLSILAHTPKVLRHEGLRDSTERLRALGTLARIRLVRMVWMVYQSVGARIH